MGYIGAGVSNASTLITFYRTSTFYPLLKITFDKIWIPEDCWKEMISGDERIDRKYADRVRALNDRCAFLVPVQVTQEERQIAKQIVKAASEQNLELHLPEALSISIALRRGIEAVLTEDRVGLQILENYEKIKGINTVSVLERLLQHYAIVFTSATELEDFLKKFEKQSSVRFSKESRSRLRRAWEKAQKDIKI